MAFSFSSIEILTPSLLVVTFTKSLSLEEVNFLPTSYSLSPVVVITSVEPPENADNISYVKLKVAPLVSGVEYTLTGSVSLSSTDDDIFDDTTVLTFGARDTKLGKVIAGLPVMYDSDEDSSIFNVLAAIHREDDKIGG